MYCISLVGVKYAFYRCYNYNLGNKIKNITNIKIGIL